MKVSELIERRIADRQDVRNLGSLDRRSHQEHYLAPVYGPRISIASKHRTGLPLDRAKLSRRP